MRLATAQELSFQDLPNISLPFIAQAEIERYITGGLCYSRISNLNQFIAHTNTRVPREQVNKLLAKINDAEVFLVYPSISESLSDTLVRLKTNLEVEQDRKGLKAEHWQVHQQLSGLAKFNAEILIQRLSYHERVYGVSRIIIDKQTQEQFRQEQGGNLPQRKSLTELSHLIDGAVPLIGG